MRLPPPAWQALAGALALILCAAPVARAGEPAFWERVAAPEGERFDRQVQAARELWQRSNDPAGAEKTLREALAAPRAGGGAADFDALFLLALIQSARGHTIQAVETLERAEPLARLPGQKADCWFRLGVERSKLGRYADALDS
jgi:tetratricopeptide (TPR) repeat protein